MSSCRSCLIGIVVAVIVAGPGTRAAAAQGGAYVDATTEWSPVTLGDTHVTWRVDRITGGVQVDGRGGWSLATERQQRGGSVDWDVQSSGYRRLGDWTVGGGVAASPSPSFLYQRAADGAVSRRVIGGLVLTGAYRYARYPSVTVHVAQPAATYYFGRNEIEGRMYVVRRMDTNQSSTIASARTAIMVAPRLRLSGGVARGARIFDVGGLPDVAPRGWVSFAAARVRVSSQWHVTIAGASAHEAPVFTQRTISIGIGRARE
jgi:YaiO family outer membrane protein